MIARWERPDPLPPPELSETPWRPRLPVPAPRVRPAVGSPAGARFQAVLCFLTGLFLPLLMFRTEYVGTPRDLFDRIAVVDLLCLVLLASWPIWNRLERLNGSSRLYLAAIGLSGVLFFVRTMSSDPEVWTGMAAMVMSFGFYVAGLQLGSRPELLRLFLAGVAVATLGEAVIAVHDYVVPVQWFPDPMEGRARGTFKASGQLAAYAFSAAGMLLTLGGTQQGRLRPFAVGTGLLATSFGILASRRGAMIAMAVWALVSLVLCWPFRKKKFYLALSGSVILVVLGLAACWPMVSKSFVAKRLEEGVEGLASKDGFIQSQFTHTLRSAEEWFPWGYGPAQGKLINRDDLQEHEVHNGILAVTVELGILGLIALLGLVLQPLVSLYRWHRSGRGEALPALWASFLLASIVFMLHNTLYRDRTFLIFLGIITVIGRRRASGVIPAGEAIPS